MTIKYNTVKKIHLYACLSTTAVLLMFILTSYVMIYHDQFDHEVVKESEVLDYDASSDDDLQLWAKEHGVPGRMVKSYKNNAGHTVLEYRNAATHTRMTFIAATGQVDVVRTTKSKADAFVGIHRNRGYGGGLSYNVYAFFLDVLGVSLILFAITGIIMWMKMLKGNGWAWLILLGGLAYFGLVWMYITFA